MSRSVNSMHVLEGINVFLLIYSNSVFTFVFALLKSWNRWLTDNLVFLWLLCPPLLSFPSFFHSSSGHLSAQRVATQVQSSGKSAGHSVASFIEELVVRRELTDNFCFYNKKYDSIQGPVCIPKLISCRVRLMSFTSCCPLLPFALHKPYMCLCCPGAYEWAQKTLKDHAKDKRPHHYAREQLEKAETHDNLWNGAQVPSHSHGRCSPGRVTRKPFSPCYVAPSPISTRWSLRGRCTVS